MFDCPTLNKFDNFRVGRFGHVLAVDLHDDVVFPDSGAVGGSAGPHRLHEDGLVAGQGQAVAGFVATDDQGSGGNAIILLVYSSRKDTATFCITTLSIMTVSIMPLSKMTLSIMTLNKMTLSLMTVCIMPLSIMTVSIITITVMTLSIMTVSIMPLSKMTLSKMTLSLMTVSIMPLSITTVSIITITVMTSA
jgi:hypothetical protein